MITEALVRTLSAQKGDPAVVSVYLDVDGRHRANRSDFEKSFEHLAAGLRRRAQSSHDERLWQSIDDDLARMRTWLSEDLDRSVTRGVAMFSCSRQGYFEVVELARPIPDFAVIGASPQVAPLMAAVDEYEPFLVALVDRRSLRLLYCDLSGIAESELHDDTEQRRVDRSVNVGGFENIEEESARAHIRWASAALQGHLRRWPTERLILGGTDEAIAALERELDVPVRNRVVGRVRVAVAAPRHEVLDAVLDVEQSVERQHEAALVEELRERAGAHEAAVVGLEPTLSALRQRRVWTLLVSEGYTTPGTQCPGCGWIGPSGDKCPACDNETVDVIDLTELAIEEALAQGAHVEFCKGTALDHFGRIGAIERY